MQLRLDDDPVAARKPLEAEAQRLSEDGFVCDVFHICPESLDNRGYHCMDARGHFFEGEHLFGCGSCGLVELAWPSSILREAGRCDLASSPDYVHTLVPNHLVRSYPSYIEQHGRVALRYRL